MGGALSPPELLTVHWGAAEHPGAGLEGAESALLDFLLSPVALCLGGAGCHFGFMDHHISHLGLPEGFTTVPVPWGQVWGSGDGQHVRVRLALFLFV